MNGFLLAPRGSWPGGSILQSLRIRRCISNIEIAWSFIFSYLRLVVHPDIKLWGRKTTCLSLWSSSITCFLCHLLVLHKCSPSHPGTSEGEGKRQQVWSPMLWFGWRVFPSVTKHSALTMDADKVWPALSKDWTSHGTISRWRLLSRGSYVKHPEKQVWLLL